jgi:hypothetical protein
MSRSSSKRRSSTTRARQTIGELEAEVLVLQALKQRALDVSRQGKIGSGRSCRKILQDDPQMRDASGRLRKLIIFTEHRDTLNYLHQKIAGVLGDADAIVTIHGGDAPRRAPRNSRRLFRSNPEVRVLIATDAAGRRREPPEREPDGQLRPAVEPEPPGAAVRPHPPHRPARRSATCGTSSRRRRAKATSTTACSRSSPSRARR